VCAAFSSGDAAGSSAGSSSACADGSSSMMLSSGGIALASLGGDEFAEEGIDTAPIADSLAKHGRALSHLGVADLDVDPTLPRFAARVDVPPLVSSPEFARFERATAELQAVDLALLTTRSAKAAFALNLYNLLSLHARLSFGTRVNRVDRSRANHRVVYRVGGHIFCQDDILNVMIRGESRVKGITKLMSRSSKSADADCHRRLAIQPIMLEALCAVCVTGSSYDPPIRAYDEENVEADLAEVGDRFLSTWVRPRVLPSKAAVCRIPKVFAMFGTDFALSDRGSSSAKASDSAVSECLLEWISEHITSSGALGERVSQCQAVEYYRTGDALAGRDGKSDTLAPLFWESST
jgi:hypothetical protein